MADLTKEQLEAVKVGDKIGIEVSGRYINGKSYKIAIVDRVCYS